MTCNNPHRDGGRHGNVQRRGCTTYYHLGNDRNSGCLYGCGCLSGIRMMNAFISEEVIAQQSADTKRLESFSLRLKLMRERVKTMNREAQAIVERSKLQIATLSSAKEL